MLPRFENLFRKGERVAAAVSGGCDSMCLLSLLLDLRDEGGVLLSCIHVQHHLRPEAEEDAQFVARFCAAHDVPFFRCDADVPAFCAETGASAEEGARTLRYRAFEERFARGDCDCVALAHHAGDLAETVLFSLIRGSGARGAASLRPVSPARTPGCRYVRPLLGAAREELEACLRARGIPHREDATNAAADCSRNILRLEALPALERAHPGAANNLCAYSVRMAELRTYLEEEAERFVLPGGAVSADVPQALLPFAAGRCLAALNAARDFSAAHAAALSGLITGRNGARASLPGGVVAERQYDRIAFFREEEAPRTEIPFGPGRFVLGDWEIGISREPPEDGEHVLYADLTKIPPDAVLRLPRAGDRFEKFGGGAKKLCDLFTDWKVPGRARPFVPLLASGSRVLAVLDRDISSALAYREGAEKIYFRTQKKEKNI